MTTVTFENLPQAVKELHEKIDYLMGVKREDPVSDYLMEVDALINYLPEHPAKQTIYQWVWLRSIPFENTGKNCTSVNPRLIAGLLTADRSPKAHEQQVP